MRNHQTSETAAAAVVIMLSAAIAALTARPTTSRGVLSGVLSNPVPRKRAAGTPVHGRYAA